MLYYLTTGPKNGGGEAMNDVLKPLKWLAKSSVVVSADVHLQPFNPMNSLEDYAMQKDTVFKNRKINHKTQQTKLW